jgi:hypothetical protein
LNQRLLTRGSSPIWSVLLLLGACNSSPPIVNPNAANALYVATNGRDIDSGTLEQPFKTVQRCADAAQPGQTCFLRAGTYRETVTPPRDGTASNPIVFKSYQGEKAVISGADPVNNWQAHQGAIYKAFVALPVNGYADTGFLANQVFIAGEMMTEARWPNTDNLLQPKLAGGCLTASSGLNATVAPEGLPNLPEGWTGATVWTGEWYTNRTGTITGGSGNSLNAAMTGEWDRGGYWCFLTGKLGLLDAEREWHYDGSSQMLYLRAAGGNAPQNVEAKTRNFAFDLTNRSYITVQNVDIFAATITTGDSSQGVMLDGLDARYVSHHVTMPPLPANQQAPGSDGALILASHTNDTGIMLRGQNNTIKNSSVQYSSGNGVLLFGRGHTVDNNIIKDANYRSSYAALVRVNGNNHKITRNTLSGAGRDAISIDWHTNGFEFKDSEIAYNDISRFGSLSNDLGGIYICCYIDQRGTRIHHNSVHSPLEFGPFWETAAIYTDIDSYNATIDHNLIWNMTVSRPVALKVANKPGQGNLERVYNNTLLAKSYFPDGAQIRNNILLQEAITGANTSNNLFIAKLEDAGFTNVANPDYTLLASSSALNAGLEILGFTDGFVGDKPDLGAFESGQTPWRAGAVR